MNKKLLPVWLIVIIDVLLIGASLLTFAFFHHVIVDLRGVSVNPEDATVFTKPTETTAPTCPETTAPTQITESTQPTETTGPLLDYSGDFGQKFAERFSIDEEIVRTDTSYKSHDIALDFSEVTFRDNVYFVIDVYIRNIENFASYVTETRGDSFDEMMEKSGIFAAVSGDYIVNAQVAVRNGVVYNQGDWISHDVCVLYYDGTLETVTPEEYNWEEITAKGPYQIWCFGPELLDDEGQPLETFNSSVFPHNPRSAIGYYEPGHYSLIAVEGRSRINEDGEVEDGQDGATLQDLADFMNSIGCTAAYNFDGGVSTHMGFNSKTVTNIVSADGSGRAIWDLLGVREIN